jgi:signal transduction histidine kinase/ActR/RegA family two-component response regulator
MNRKNCLNGSLLSHVIIEKTKRYIHIKLLLCLLVIIIVTIYFFLSELHITGFLTTIAAVLFCGATSLVILYLIKTFCIKKWMLHVSLALDMFIVILAVYFTGAIVNTWLFFPVIIIFAASYLFAVKTSLIYATAAYMSIVLIFVLEYNNIIPHFGTYGFPENFYHIFPLYWQDALLGMFILYYVSALISGYLTFIMNKALDKAEKNNLILKDEILKRRIVEKELKRHRDDLELTVNERTAEIQQKNNQLIKEIEERKQTEEEKKEIEIKLQRAHKMETLGLLAGSVAHDLNNILSGVVNYPELILLDPSLDNELREHIVKIQESGLRAADMVADLLTLTKGIASTKEILNINKIIEDFLMSAEYKKLQNDNTCITLNKSLDPGLLNIKCSRIHFRKALMNLVINAYEAVDNIKTGIIDISTENTYLACPLEAYTEIPPGEYVILKIKDNGKGIPLSDLEKIFEPFYTKKVMGRKGTGLGLTVVWNTVQNNNGYINIISNEKGTQFELYFKVIREDIYKEAHNLSVNDIKGNGEKILVVDDESLQREIACEILNKLGYKTNSVSSGNEAVKYLNNNSADLIIIDMIMNPGINGRETYKKIIKNNPHQKAIIASGYSKTEDVKKTQKLGAGSYIKKPYTIIELGQAVKMELMADK